MPLKHKIVFLDRDGVILNNSIHYYIYREDDMEYIPGIFEKLKTYARQGYIFILISNQGGIAKGLYQIENTEKLHQKIKMDFLANGLLLTDDFYCPHHPEKGLCLCRKPDSLMLEKAIAKWNADLDHSFMVGDSDRDIESAKKAGLKAYKIKSNSDTRNCTDW